MRAGPAGTHPAIVFQRAVVPEIAEQFEGLLVAGGGSWVVASQLLHNAQVVVGPGLVGPVAEGRLLERR
jgi:hypothetical protein